MGRPAFVVSYGGSLNSKSGLAKCCRKERTVFDHIGVGVSDLKASKAFFLRALSPLGVGVVMEVSDAAGLGRGQKPSLWLGATNVSRYRFTSPSRQTIEVK
jgi:hypothetical protein